MNLKHTISTAAIIAVCGAGSNALAQSEQVLFFENFDALPLGQNVEEGIVTGQGGVVDNVWTPDFPAGWTVDFNLEGIGTLEWQGWNIADGQWWAFTTGDQDRTDFVEPDENGLGRNAIAIADGDEWDDYDANGLDPDSEGFMNTMMATPAFDISGVTAGSIDISFFSSWRPEDLQTAVVEVRFDGGTWDEVLRWSSDGADPNFHDDNTNEIVAIPVNNPAGAASMEVRFSYLDGANDWWWAVDTIEVTGERLGAPTNPPGHSFVQAMTFNDSARPVITVGQAAGAEDYTVVLAKDGDFSDVRLSTTADASGSFQLPAVPNGIYFLKTVANNSAGSRDSENSLRIVVDDPILIDFDGSGSLNFFDVSAYLQFFNAGCP